MNVWTILRGLTFFQNCILFHICAVLPQLCQNRHRHLFSVRAHCHWSFFQWPSVLFRHVLLQAGHLFMCFGQALRADFDWIAWLWIAQASFHFAQSRLAKNDPLSHEGRTVVRNMDLSAAWSFAWKPHIINFIWQPPAVFDIWGTFAFLGSHAGPSYLFEPLRLLHPST